MTSGVLARKPEVTAAHAQKSASTSLRIGEPDDVLEQEADRVANEVMTGGHANWSLGVSQPQLLRKCSCSGSAECDDCNKERKLQRKGNGTVESVHAPPIVHGVLRSPGQSLDPRTRTLFESRFGHDFSRVRIHADRNAAQSTVAVNAKAYTAGHHIAFGAGEYAPGTHQGMRLLAHELTHVIQQERAGAQGRLQRVPLPLGAYRIFEPCLLSPECANPIPGSSWDFARHPDEQKIEYEKKQAKEKAEKAKTQKQPAKQKQTEPDVQVLIGEVHVIDTGAPGPATSLRKVVEANDKSLLAGIYDVVVNPKIEVAGGQMNTCDLASPKPKDPAARCIEVPRRFEEEAKDFDSGAKAVGGRSRQDWLTYALGAIRHEQAHAEFEKAPPVAEGKTTDDQHVFDFSKDIFRFELGELNSILSEFHIHYRREAGSKEGDKIVRQFIIDYVNNRSEGIRGILKKLRCITPCIEADVAIQKVFDSQSQHWTDPEKQFVLGILKDPAQALDWPK